MRCAVLGQPIGHSLSPALHTAAYAELGLDWTYVAREVASDELEAFIDGLDESWRGLSLTMPLKRVVVPLLDTLDDWSRLSGVVNTVLLGDGRRAGANTDVPGARAAVEESLAEVGSAVVLGGGATAASVLLALTELGLISAQLLVRDPQRAEETVSVVRRHPRAPDITVTPIDRAERLQADLVVSTVPAAAQSPALLAACAEVPAVFEVVYEPWPTPLAAAAISSGRTLVTGLDLLVHQAALQVELMTGSVVAVERLRAAARTELERRARDATGSSTGQQASGPATVEIP